MIKGWIICVLISCSCSICKAQELQARITVTATNISSQTDRKIFQTLQAALNSFLNTRKWAKETFDVNEKINCNFLLNVIPGQVCIPCEIPVA